MPPRLRRRAQQAQDERAQAAQALTDVHRQMQRLTERRPAATIRTEAERTSSDVGRALRRNIGRRLPAPATQTSLYDILRTASSRLERAAARLAAQVQEMEQEAYLEAVARARVLVRVMDRSEDTSELLHDRQTLMLMVQARAAESAAHIETLVSGEIAQINAAVSARAREMVAAGSSNEVVIDAVAALIEAEFWRIVRAVRTYLASVYNSALADATAVLAREDKTIYLRWVEHVDDATGMPTDEKTAADSIQLHGQVRKPDKLFTMPREESVSPKMWGKQWSYPPNRPNDRAVVMPWRKEWGIPGYEYRGFRRVWLVRR